MAMRRTCNPNKAVRFCHGAPDKRGMFMCDFRKITKIKLTATEEIIDLPNGPIQLKWEERDKYWNTPEDLEPGLYHIPASGSFHMYYTGNEWLTEKNFSPHYKNGWEVLEYENIYPWCEEII